jgi:NADPH:quinone reductase-like Zn-dependent oxidoreductase
MRAIVLNGYGAPHDVLRLTDVDEPLIADDAVLVEVQATSVNSADWHIIRADPALARLQFGLRRPNLRVPGCDFAGIVKAVGKDVTSVGAGDEVFGCSFMQGFGTFAERVSAPEHLVARKPANLTYAEAAAVPLAAMTALQGLRDHGRIEAGQHVLIVGASGGVGTFAVQIAKSLGAVVTAVCSTRNTELVRGLGADNTLDYTTDDFTHDAARYDLVLQVAGAQSASACRRVLTATGTLVQISGDSNHRWIGPVPRVIGGKLLSPFGKRTVTSFTVRPSRTDLEHLTTLIESRAVTPVIDRTFPLSETAAAIDHVHAGHPRGKVVITV